MSVYQLGLGYSITSVPGLVGQQHTTLLEYPLGWPEGRAHDPHWHAFHPPKGPKLNLRINVLSMSWTYYYYYYFFKFIWTNCFCGGVVQGHITVSLTRCYRTLTGATVMDNKMSRTVCVAASHDLPWPRQEGHRTIPHPGDVASCRTSPGSSYTHILSFLHLHQPPYMSYR